MAATVMTVRELAAYLQVHQSTIYRLLKRLDLPGFKIGSDWRFLKSQVDEWMIEAVKEQRNVAALSGQRLRAAK